MKVNHAEAEIVREIFRRFTSGEKAYGIRLHLNQRDVPSAKGRTWTETTIRRQLQNKHVAGINVHRGQEIGVGRWPAIITRAQWDFAQEMLAFRSAAAQSERAARTRRTYILRGLERYAKPLPCRSLTCTSVARWRGFA